MPIYEYLCQSCESRFDKITSSSTKDSEIKCPVCGEFKSKKQISMFSSRLNSGGVGSSFNPGRFT